LYYRVHSTTYMQEACLSTSKLLDLITLLYGELSTACSLLAPTLTIEQPYVLILVYKREAFL
jgi:hypothetical protein